MKAQCRTEVNGLEDPSAYHEAVTNRITRWVPWTEPNLHIIRLRLLSDPGSPAWDVSYCHGMIGGEPVRVILPFDQLPKSYCRCRIVEYAKRDGIYAKGLGIFNAISLCQ